MDLSKRCFTQRRYKQDSKQEEMLKIRVIPQPSGFPYTESLAAFIIPQNHKTRASIMGSITVYILHNNDCIIIWIYRQTRKEDYLNNKEI